MLVKGGKGYDPLTGQEKYGDLYVKVSVDQQIKCILIMMELLK